MPYVYILKSLKDSKQYIGSTVDLKQRLKKHNSGHVPSTRNRRPLVLYAYQEFESIHQAALFEKKYKKSHDMVLRRIKAGLMKVAAGRRPEGSARRGIV